ncbi:hypothetical protein [Desulfosporosinus sp. SB140]|uniref:hypothetical protein n=1 Tax=Desulfosporosinus paludis TaxID=3115649 RepID=UPI00389105A3
MIKGIKPKTAINAILGQYLAEKEFVFDIAHGSEAYFYKRIYNESSQQLCVEIRWAPEFMVKEYMQFKDYFPDQQWEAYQHSVNIRLNSISADKTYRIAMDVHGLLKHYKYPELRPHYDRVPPEILDARQNLYKKEPLLNGYFITHEQFKQRLLALRQLMEEYGMPFLENESDWPIKGKV